MTAWTRTKLGECATFVSGGTPSKSHGDYWGGSVPWVSAKDMKTPRLYSSEDTLTEAGAADVRTVDTGAILILVRGMTLHRTVPLGLVRTRMAFNQDVKALLPRAGVDPAFLFYNLAARQPELHGLVDAAGHGTGRIHTYLLSDFPMALPPIEEQRKISGVLSLIDDTIEANTAIVQAAESLISTRLELRADHREGWRLEPISKLARFVNGGAFTKDSSGTGRIVIRIRELNSGLGESTAFSDIEVPKDQEADAGDVLFSWSGSLGVYRWSGPNAIINQHIFKVVPACVPTWFVFSRLVELMPEFRAIAAGKATTMGHIQRFHLDEAKVLVPPESELALLDEELDPVWRVVLACEAENERLRVLMGELAPGLISGSLAVAGDGAERGSAPEATMGATVQVGAA